jgi:hypothetical protein
MPSPQSVHHSLRNVVSDLCPSVDCLGNVWTMNSFACAQLAQTERALFLRLSTHASSMSAPNIEE